MSGRNYTKVTKDVSNSVQTHAFEDVLRDDAYGGCFTSLTMMIRLTPSKALDNYYKRYIEIFDSYNLGGPVVWVLRKDMSVDFHPGELLPKYLNELLHAK